MKLPRTANDDQPGPIGRRHNSTGGDLDQSVSIRTPGTTPSRLGPRKPGHSTRVIPGSRGAGPSTRKPPRSLRAGDAAGTVTAGAAGSAAGAEGVAGGARGCPAPFTTTLHS